MLFRPVSAAFALALAMVPAVAAAQRISFAPTVGVYIPTSELIKAASGQQFKQEITIDVGGRLGIGLSRRLGVELAGTYAPSKLKFDLSSTGGAATKIDANVFSGSGKINLQLIPITSPVAFIVSGGVGVVRRSGAAYTDSPHKTDVGGVVGASLRLNLGGLLRLQFSAEDYVYKAKYAPSLTTSGGFTLVDKTQNDIHLSVGIGL